MNTVFWIITGSVLLVANAFLFVDAFRSNKTRAGKQQIPLFYAFLIGPLYYFILSNHQRKERRTFMENKRRFS